MAGEYRQVGEPLMRQLGGYTVVGVPLSFEAGEMKGRVAYDAGGGVSGLFVLKPDNP